VGNSGGEKVVQDSQWPLWACTVPLFTKPKDIICIFRGAETPFVVRPTGSGTHTLIGPCYVDGIIDGEAVASGEYQNQDILLE
jgi:hypothetical protein